MTRTLGCGNLSSTPPAARSAITHPQQKLTTGDTGDTGKKQNHILFYLSPCPPCPPWFISPRLMPAELAAHRLHDLPGEVFLVPRREARVQRRRQHRARHALVDGGHDRPAALAGVRHAVLLDR